MNRLASRTLDRLFALLIRLVRRQDREGPRVFDYDRLWLAVYDETMGRL